MIEWVNSDFTLALNLILLQKLASWIVIILEFDFLPAGSEPTSEVLGRY
jgi:hypothetical protein